MSNKIEKIKVIEEERLRRKDLGLPVTKPLRYMSPSSGVWKEYPVLEYEIIETFKVTGSHILLLTLDGHEPVKIFDAYFAHMQKPSFVEDMDKSEEE